MNKRQKAQTLSIIIPVYNEENYLENCLVSIKNQTIRPLEVIVVDNNSTDGSVDIAKKFDFVKVAREKRQHQSFAQKTGFELASGDILGRIDADSILPEDWVEKTLGYFNRDTEAVAVSGSGKAYDISFPAVGQFIFNIYFKLAGFFAGHRLTWGSNCAFRRSVWPQVGPKLTLRSDIWEDYDLGFCLNNFGKIKYVSDNDVYISYRSIHKSPAQSIRYEFRSVRTFYFHRNLLTTTVFAASWLTLLAALPLIAIDYYILRPIKKAPLIKLLLTRLSLIFS